MTFEGWNWSLIGSVAGLFTTLFAGIQLLNKWFRRKRKPKPTEEEKLQRKHAKTRSNADQNRPPDMAWPRYTPRAKPPSKPRPRPTSPPPEAVVVTAEKNARKHGFDVSAQELSDALGRMAEAGRVTAQEMARSIKDGLSNLHCDKTVADCKRHGNFVRYGGFPKYPNRDMRCGLVFGGYLCTGEPVPPKPVGPQNVLIGDGERPPPLEETILNKGADPPDYITK